MSFGQYCTDPESTSSNNILSSVHCPARARADVTPSRLRIPGTALTATANKTRLKTAEKLDVTRFMVMAMEVGYQDLGE